MDKDDWTCPHCEEPLVRWEPCAQTGWSHDLFLCDNNECAYFVEGRRKIACDYEKNFPIAIAITLKMERSCPL